MTVYLLHLNSPLARGISPAGQALFAAHYIGFTRKEEVAQRMADHMQGRGNPMLRAAVLRGISWQIARLWQGPLATRALERRLKNCKHAARFCPICNPRAARHGTF